MLDLKVESFLTVYKHRSYTKAAQELCITQPAVTQHIQYLERYYGCKLFKYSSRDLKPTQGGDLLYKYAQNAKANEEVIKQRIGEVSKANKTLKFAATLTIGEFTLAPILADFIKAFKEYDITMYIDNTETVLEMLHKGEISFVLIEGLFNKADYQTRLYKNTSFILTVPPGHFLTFKKTVFLEDIRNETLLVREKGSGSREILERALYDKSHTLESFKRIIEIGNVSVIKQMVKDQMGISFMYKDAAQYEIKKGELVEITIEDFMIEREFNFINRKNDIMEAELDRFYDFFLKQLRKKV